MGVDILELEIVAMCARIDGDRVRVWRFDPAQSAERCTIRHKAAELSVYSSLATA